MDRKEYLELRQKIIEAYEKIRLEPQFLPAEKIDILKKQAANLHAEKFIVAVCGQTKAGKSTLLNAVIFKKPILPTDDTPFTSRITSIEYGLMPHCDIYFYNNYEWQELNIKRPTSAIEQSQAEFLAGETIRAFKNGVREKDCITEKGLLTQLTNLDELHEYICHGGKYTPFVKEACLYFPADILKHVTFIDCPDTNDPNHFNVKPTIGQIQQAHAVIYVCCAEKQLSDSDLDFIDQSLLHVPPNQRIIAINKIDQVSDFQKLQQWVYELGNTESRRGKCLFGESATICYVSGLGALISALLKNKQNISYEYEQLCSDLSERGFLSETGHLIEHFQDRIEKNLIEQRGQIILRAHKSFIENSFIEGRSSRQSRIEHLQSRIKLIEQDHDKLRNLLNNSLEKQEYIKEGFNTFGRNLDQDITMLIKLFIAKIKEIRKTLLEEIKEESCKTKDLQHLQIEFPWIVKHSLELAHPVMKEIGQNYLNQIGKITGQHLEYLEKTLQADTLISKNELSELLKRSSTPTVSLFITTLQEVIESNTMASLFQELAPAWRRWLMPGRSLENVRTELFSMLKNFFFDQFESFTNELNKDLISSLEKIIAETAKEVHTINEILKGEINYHLHNEQKCANRIHAEKQEIANLQTQITELQKLQNQLGLHRIHL